MSNFFEESLKVNKASQAALERVAFVLESIAVGYIEYLKEQNQILKDDLQAKNEARARTFALEQEQSEILKRATDSQQRIADSIPPPEDWNVWRGEP